MTKKEYTKPEMLVVNITSCTLLAASTLYQGSADSGSSPAKDDDDWYYGDQQLKSFRKSYMDSFGADESSHDVITSLEYPSDGV